MSTYLVPSDEKGENAAKDAPFVVSEDIKQECDTLLDMLRYRRPAGSKSENRFIKRFLIPLGLEKDRFGNLYKRIPGAPILWSSHTDTVHDCKGMQALGFDKQEVGISAEEKISNCLGADDTAGVWLMQQMILNKVPGLYIFHREEEVGCNGSKFIAQTMKDQLEGIKFAIALDRKGQDNIITHQRSKRCCSEEFAKSLGSAIGLGFKADDTGVYTDTASYVDLIPECTNISVGYHSQHGKFERLDLDFIFRLRDSLVTAEWSGLEEKRKAGDNEWKSFGYTPSTTTHGSYYGGSYHHNSARKLYNGMDLKLGDDGVYYDDHGWMYADPFGHECIGFEKTSVRDATDPDNTGDEYAQLIENIQNGNPSGDTSPVPRKGQSNGVAKDYSAVKAAERAAIDPDEDDEHVPTSSRDWVTFCRLVERNPEAVAEILESYGCGVKELEEEIMCIAGAVNY